MRSWEPGWPLMFWNSRAGPPLLVRFRRMGTLSYLALDAVGDFGYFEDWVDFGLYSL